MVDKITVNPSEVRGAGDIVSPKSSSDFSFYNSYIQSSTQTVNDAPMTVYQMFKWGNYNLVLDFDKFVAYSEELTSFPVEVTLKNQNDKAIVGATLTCTVNGNTVLSEVTNSRGQAIFNVPVTYDGVYHCTVEYHVQTSTSGGVSGATKSFKVYVGVLNSILLRSSMNPLMTSDKSVLFCNVDYLVGSELLPAPGVKVNFYEEYVLDRIHMMGYNTVENGSVLPLMAKVSDTDGSGIPSQPVKFFEEWDGGDLVFVNPVPIVQSGNVAEISARLTDVDGSGIAGETIMFYEEYTMGSLRLKLDKNLIETDVVTPISASFRDIDGSLIQVAGTSVNFFEDYTISDVNLFGDKTFIIPGERVGFTARVTDGDGSPVPGETVMFYEEFTRTYLDVDMSTDTVVSDEESELSALVRDSDGSRVRNSIVEFTSDFDSTDWNVWFDDMTMNGSVEIGDEVPVSASVYDDDSNPVSGVYVRFVADMIPEETIIPDSDPEPVYPVGSVVLVGDGKSILSAYDGDTCNLTVTVKDTHNNVMEGESVVFKAGSSVLDTVETDSDGIASYTYTAVGSGDVSFTASVGSLVSEIYVVQDCSYWNDGSSVGSLEVGSNVSCTSNGEYITITTSTSGEKDVKIPVALTGDWEFETTLAENMALGSQLTFKIGTGQQWGGFNADNTITVSLGSSQKFSRTVQKDMMFKITYINGTMTVYWNNEQLVSKSLTLSSGVKMGYYTNSGRYQYIKNIKLKPL